ncbi:MAG: hypothetical protein ACJ8C4_13125 [Gemmataceae bacterium]
MIAAVLLGCGLLADVAWGIPKNGLATRLTVVTKEPVLGQPVQLKLDIKNVGTTPAKYDDQQAMVNNSLEVLGPEGKPVPSVGMSTQTIGSETTLAPAAEKSVFGSLDITEQYLLEKPGKYTIRFRAQHHGNMPESNQLTVILKDGPLSDQVKLLSALLKAAPAGWRVARDGDEISFVNSPTNLKRDVAVVSLFFTKDENTSRVDAEKLGRTKMGYAWLEISPKSSANRWPDSKKVIEEQLKAFR